MDLLPRMNVMLHFICVGPVDLPGARRKRRTTKQNQTLLPTVGLKSTTLYQLSYPGFDESCPIKVTCSSDINVYIDIKCRIIRKSVFGLVHILFCITSWNISISDK